MTAPDVDDRPRFVVHLTLRAADLAGAHLLARALARSLAFLPELVLGETTVTVDGAPDVHHQVFCDRLLGHGWRCLLRPDHDGDCSRRFLRPVT
ncbi:hypothetical protein QTQ03_16075 [Micromonospora sp. WMMA1363]|uniref:hypothetical protein n=1 Tax=Micromonospora sp. WMMA1363 TaxID=3053985 RepID=UPI00259C930A|nr:hypothetical protein [Micromonospora sp. WMMA1363]MDM4721039.1 hypothetical protein [Micromonospora sp. WMMA1363]